MDVCKKSNMKYNARVSMPVSAKGTSEVTQTAQFILRGLIAIGLPSTYIPSLLETLNVGPSFHRGTASGLNAIIPEC